MWLATTIPPTVPPMTGNPELQAGLRDEEPRGGGRDRSGVRHLDYVPELRERHGPPFRGHFSPLF